MSTLPLTANRVTHVLQSLAQELEVTVRQLQVADLDATQKRHKANMAESEAFVEATGAMDIRKHLARIAAGPLEKDALVAEALARHFKASVYALNTRIEVERSLGAAVRAELRTLPGSEG